MIKKQFQIVYKFADVIDNIEAETLEDATRIANDRAYYGDSEQCPIESTECYDIEIEEIKEEEEVNKQ